MKLLKFQKAALYKILHGAQFDPARFRWDKDDHDEEVLRVLGTDYFFSVSSSVRRDVIDGDKDVFLVIVSPGNERMEERYTAPNWSAVCLFFGYWCNYVRREVDTRDPWEGLERQAISLDYRLAGTESDQPFSVGEYEKIHAALGLLRAEMLEMARGNTQQCGKIEAGIGTLMQTAKTEGRRSFFINCATFVFSSALTMALAPEQTRQLFLTLKAGLTSVIHFLG